MIEAIAQRWFEQEPATQSPRWDHQPEHLKDVFRRKAAEFWERPGALAHELHMMKIRERNGR